MEPQIPKPVESFSATLKSIEPKFVLKSKTVLGIILVVGLVLSLIFDIDTQEAMTKAEKLVGLIGGILVVIGLRTKTQPLTFKTKLPSGATNILLAMGMLSMALASGVGLTSCTSLGGSLPAISITPDLCVAAKINKTLADGSERLYMVKWCPDGRVEAVWNQNDLQGNPVRVMAVYNKRGGHKLSYHANGAWLDYDSKAGLVIQPPSVDEFTRPDDEARKIVRAAEEKFIAETAE